jgi:toxin FitB
MFLIDTNVLSEQRKMSANRADANVAQWLRQLPEAQGFLSAMTVFELEKWVLLRGRRDVEQGRRLRQWLDGQVLVAFAGRILPVQGEVARACAALRVPDPRSLADSLIAATALVHGLTVVTRDIADFAPMGVKLLNPWEPQ